MYTDDFAQGQIGRWYASQVLVAFQEVNKTRQSVGGSCANWKVELVYVRLFDFQEDYMLRIQMVDPFVKAFLSNAALL